MAHMDPLMHKAFSDDRGHEINKLKAEIKEMKAEFLEFLEDEACCDCYNEYQQKMHPYPCRWHQLREKYKDENT